LLLLDKLGDGSVFLTELADARLEVVNAMDRTQDEPAPSTIGPRFSNISGTIRGITFSML
jgi:hypothetical protein